MFSPNNSLVLVLFLVLVLATRKWVFSPLVCPNFMTWTKRLISYSKKKVTLIATQWHSDTVTATHLLATLLNRPGHCPHLFSTLDSTFLQTCRKQKQISVSRLACLPHTWYCRPDTVWQPGIALRFLAGTKTRWCCGRDARLGEGEEADYKNPLSWPETKSTSYHVLKVFSSGTFSSGNKL